VDTAGQKFVVGYVRDSIGAWAFTKARATVDATDAQAVAAIYESYESALRDRFDKPAWVNDAGGPLP
jgi:hypothetical protein